MCSRHEVETYLKKREYDAAEIVETLERLQEYGYLDDLEAGRQVVRKYAGRYGWHYISLKLRQKGLFSPELLQKLRGLSDHEAENVSAKVLLEKNRKRFLVDGVFDRRKAARFLQNRGYASTVINNTLHIMSETDLD